MTLEEKNQALLANLKSLGKVLIAFSGGVDSTFLLAAAVEAIGAENILACMARGPVTPEAQYELAKEIAANLNVQMQTIDQSELSNADFVSNKADRCFHCKMQLINKLKLIAEQNEIKHILFGTNSDDFEDYRPGNRAIQVSGAKSPLADAELSKDEIRLLSKDLNLPTAEMPASPCLASRVPYGTEITAEILSKIEQGEAFLKSAGFSNSRVRYHGDVARIELPEDEIAKAINDRTKIIEKIKSLGFKYVTIDLQGFRSGSLNETLTEETKRKHVD